MAESHFLFKAGNFAAPRGAIRSGPETHSANRKCLKILIPAFRESGAVGGMCIPNCACRRRQTFCVRIIDLVGTSLSASVVLHRLQPPSPPIFISNASEDIGPLFMTTEIYTCATRLSARVAQKDGSLVQLPSRVPTIKILAPFGASNISNNFDPISPALFCRVAAALTDKNGAAKQDFSQPTAYLSQPVA